ncbi:MAG: CCR4-NOT transcription complex subunit 6-like [Paramarteilia canceri]
MLTNLHVLNVSNNFLTYLPPEIGNLVKVFDLNVSNNCLQFLPAELGKLHLLEKLKVYGNNFKDSNLNEILNHKSSESTTHDIQQYLLNSLNDVLLYKPKHREIIPIRTLPSIINSKEFSTMSYNVLFDKYCTSSLYPYCPQWARKWNYRQKLILKEIKNHKSGIISLQEVGTGHFESFFLPELTKLGYGGIFCPKSRSHTIDDNDQKLQVDGCAIFYKNSNFKLIRDYVIDFCKTVSPVISECEDMFNRVMVRDNVALAALLKFDYNSPNSKLLLVVNTHIHWDPEYSDVKLVQSIILLKSIKQIQEEIIAEYYPQSVDDKSGENAGQKHSIPTVLCGDFNSHPDSGVFDIIVNGKVASDHIDFKDFKYGPTLSKLINSDSKNGELKSPLSLKSVFGNQDQQYLDYTNFTNKFKAIIDYIFYSPDTLSPNAVLGDIDPNWFEQTGQAGMPNPHFPSDHIPLYCKFSWI